MWTGKTIDATTIENMKYLTTAKMEAEKKLR